MSEDQLVYEWNLKGFERQGFDEEQRLTLLAWGLSPHDTEQLVSVDCPRDLVLRILQPDDDIVVLAVEPELVSV